MGKVLAVCTSHKKGIRKKDVGEARFVENSGIEHDAHAGNWHRQVSLLAWESIEKMRAKGLNVNVGSFAENITTREIDLVSLPVGQHIMVGQQVILQVTQIGKECHTRCAIYYVAGDCVMPKEGIFARVIRGGTVRVGDSIAVLENTAIHDAFSAMGGQLALLPAA